MRQLPWAPPFFEIVEGPLLTMPCIVLGYYVAFQTEPLSLATLEVITKKGYFAFDSILLLQSILPFNVCVSSKLAYLLQCS